MGHDQWATGRQRHRGGTGFTDGWRRWGQQVGEVGGWTSGGRVASDGRRSADGGLWTAGHDRWVAGRWRHRDGTGFTNGGSSFSHGRGALGTSEDLRRLGNDRRTVGGWVAGVRQAVAQGWHDGHEGAAMTLHLPMGMGMEVGSFANFLMRREGGGTDEHWRTAGGVAGGRATPIGGWQLGFFFFKKKNLTRWRLKKVE